MARRKAAVETLALSLPGDPIAERPVAVPAGNVYMRGVAVAFDILRRPVPATASLPSSNLQCAADLKLRWVVEI
jgi:hypothetical protein